MSGWIIGLHIKGDGAAYRLFAVAEPDQETATALLSQALQMTTGDEYVEVAGPISADHLRALGVKSGAYGALS